MLAIAGAAVFVAAYMVLVLTWRSHRHRAAPWVLFALLIVTASALTLASRPGWAFLFSIARPVQRWSFPHRSAFSAFCCAVDLRWESRR